MSELKIKVVVDDEEAKRKLENLYAVAKNNLSTVTKEQVNSSLKISQSFLTEGKAATESAKQTKLAAEAKLADSRAALNATRQQTALAQARIADTRAVTEQARATAAQTRALAEQTRAEAALARAQEQAERSRRSSQSGGGGAVLPRTFAGFTTAGAVQAGLAAVGFSGVQAVAAGAVGLTKEVIETRANYESLERGLTAVTGSAAKTQAQLERLREVAKLPGLGFEEAVKGATRLQAAGLSAAESEKALRGFGKAIAQVGGGREELDGVVLALGQIASKSKVSAEEINQLAERIPQIRKIMQEAFGTSDTMTLQKAGIDTKTFLHVLIEAADKTKEVSGGMKNNLQNIKDAFGDLFDEIGRRGQPVIEGIINPLEQFVRLGAKSLKTGREQSTINAALQRISVGGSVGDAAGLPGFKSALDARISGLEKDLNPISHIPNSDPRLPAGVVAQRDALDFYRSARRGLAFQSQYEDAGGISESGRPGIDAVALANAGKNAEAIISKISKAKTRAEVESLRKRALDAIAGAPAGDQAGLRDKLSNAYTTRISVLKREDEVNTRKSMSAAQRIYQDAVPLGIANENQEFDAILNSMAMSTPVQGVSHIFAGLQAMTGDKGLSNGNFMATGRGFHEQYQIAEQDARYAAELKEQKNEQRLEELRKSYDFVIRFLEDEQSALHDAVREAIDNNDVPAARNALKSLSDNRARVAGYQFNKGIVEAQPTDAFSTVGAYLNNLPQLAQNIRNSQREISPIEKELRQMETSQRIAAELRADEQSNRGRIQAGAAVGAAGSVTAEAIGAAIKSGIESGNAQSALRGLGLSLAGSFTDALTRESVIRPLTRMFNRLGDEIANGGMRAGASIYQAAIAGASILQVSQRKKKVGAFSLLGAAAAFYLSGGNPSATAAGYTAGNSLDNRDVGGAFVSTGLAYASGQFSGGSSPTDSQWSAQNLPGNSRAVQITNNYGVVNDKADATRIVNLQIKQLYNATAVGS